MFTISRLIISIGVVGLLLLNKSFRRKIFQNRAAVFIVVGLVLLVCLLSGLVVPESSLVGFSDPSTAHKYMTIANDYDYEVAVEGEKSTLMIAVSENPRNITPALLLKKGEKWFITAPLRYTFKNVCAHENRIFVDLISHPWLDECYWMITTFDLDPNNPSSGSLDGVLPNTEFLISKSFPMSQDCYRLYCLPKGRETFSLDVGGRLITYVKTADGWMQNGSNE